MNEYSTPVDWENKALRATTDADSIHENFLRAFEDFKHTNDERLAQIEARMSADIVTSDKLDRINRALDGYKQTVDELMLKAARPQRGGAAPHTGASVEHKAAFEAYIRQGESNNLRRLEEKALSIGSDPDGGYLVPPEIEANVMSALRETSPIRGISTIRQVSSSTYKKPFAITGAATGWVGETDARAQTNTPTLSELAFPTMELFAMPAATQSLLDDAAINIDEWVGEEVRLAFADQENTAFVSGDGVNKPKGFLSYTTVPNDAWEWGKISYLATGMSGAFSTDPADILIDLVYALKAGYRANAHWVMNRSTQAEIRKIKDGDGNYIWRPGEQAGQDASLMAFPITETEDMPEIAADAYAIAFGDFGRGYLVVDRVGLRVLRDPYSAKPYVLFYTTKRVGGGVQDFNAIKLLKFAE